MRQWTSIVLVMLLAGCMVVLPRKADLDKVHEAYRSDFLQFFIVESPQSADCRGRDFAFDRTLEAIRQFEAKYRGETTSELGHVTVLKGMVHLQAGHFGVARQLASGVEAATITAADDREVRDTLFKQVFRELVDGWQAACESVAASVVSDGAFSAGANERRSVVLARASQRIADVVKPLLPERARRGVESDDGAIYLATTASIFAYYTFRMVEDTCRAAADPRSCIANSRTEFAPKVQPFAQLLYGLLSSDERHAVDAQERCRDEGRAARDPAAPWRQATTQARQRYVSWYLELESKLGCAA